MNYAGKFGSGGLESLSSTHVDLDSLSHRGHADAVTVPDAHLLFSGDFHKSGPDLIISDQFHRVVVPDYFRGEKHPTLVSPGGAPLDPKVVDALTGHTEYAQAGGAPAAKVVGHVVKMTGSASVVRNGVTVDVQNGDAVYQSDVVQTGSGSTLGLVLNDGTTFNLSAGARLMLNDLTYDASSTSNSALFTLVQGAANFVAGQVAKTGDMKVATPVATMGIRGTAVVLDVDATDGTVSISVIDQHDGVIHAVAVFNTQGVQIGTVTSNGTTLTLTPTANFNVIAQESNKTPAQIAQEFAAFQAALDTYNLQKAIDPNLPQHTDNNANPQTKFAANGSSSANSPSTEYHAPAGSYTVTQTSSTTSGITTFTVASTDTGSTGAPPPPPESPPPATQPPTTPTSPPFVVTPPTVSPITSGEGNHTNPVMSASGDVVYDPDGIVYFYDRASGVTTRVTPANDGFTYSGQTISSDGRYVAYQGTDGTHTYVYVWGTDPSDTAHYHVQTLLAAGGSPAISGDGSTILVEQAGGSIGIYDLQGHSKGTITPASVGASGALSNPAISADGHVIAFWSSDTANPSGPEHLYTYNVSTGVVTEIASSADGGAPAASISADGHYVVYQSHAADRHTEISLYDVTTGQVVYTTASAHEILAGDSKNPVISPDGHFIIFTSTAELTPGDTNTYADTYVVDVTNPNAPVYTLISEHGDAPSDSGVAISAGGLFVAFGSSASFYTGSTGSNIFVADPTSGRAAIIQETASSPDHLTAGGTIGITGGSGDVTLTVTDPDGHATDLLNAVLSADGQSIQWSFSEAKSDFAALHYGQDLTQQFLITLNYPSGKTTVSVTVDVHDAVQPVITPVDVAPVATPVTLADGQENHSYVITPDVLLAHVADIDGPQLSITDVSVKTGGGTLLHNEDGSWTYTPAEGFQGEVVFNYTASDGTLTSSSTANLNLTHVDQAPLIDHATLSVTQGGTVTLTSANLSFIDPDGPDSFVTYTVSNVHHGAFLVYDGESYTSATTFTSDDVAAGHVRFVDDGSSLAPSFSVAADDGIESGPAVDGTVNLITTYTLTSTAGVSITVPPEGATAGFVFPGAGNVTTPGTPEDRIVLGYDNGATHVVLNSDPMEGTHDFGTISSMFHSDDSGSSVTTTLDAGNDVTLTQTISLGADANFFTTTIDINNAGSSDLSDVRFMRTFDPDQDVQFGGTYDTYNDVVHNPGEDGTIAIVSATGPSTHVTAALVGIGGQWVGSVFGFTNTDPYAPGAYDHPVDPNGALDDLAISLTDNIGTVAAGSHVEVTYLTTANVATDGNNALYGTSGNDTIDGLGGDDLLIGLGGADTFVLSPRSGHDTIFDFTPGTDKIELDKVPGVPVNSDGKFTEANLDAWKAAPGVFETQGSDVLIHLSSASTVLLKNVSVDDLHACDFVVEPVDVAPVASPVTLADGTEDTLYTIHASDLLANVTDTDGPSLSISALSVSGGGNLHANDDGTCTYTPAANYYGPVSFNYTASDGTLTASSTASLTLAAVNDPPVFTASDLAPVYQHGADPVALAGSVSVSDVDNANFAGGSLTATVTDGGHQGDTLTIAADAHITLDGNTVMFDADGPGGNEAVAIGTLTDNINSLTIALNDNASDAAVAALTQAIEFKNTKPDPDAGTRTVTFTLHDGGGTANGGHDSDFFTATVDVMGPPTVSITVLTPDGLDFHNDAPLREMGAGGIQYGGSSTTFTIVDPTDNVSFVVDGSNFTYGVDPDGISITGGTLTSFHEFTADGKTALADFTGLTVDAVTWMSDVRQAGLADNKGPIEALTSSFAYNFIGGPGNDNFGSAGQADTLSGTGKDFFDGGGAPAGSHDTLTGGAGSTFVFVQGYGALTITNFDQASGVFNRSDGDHIELDGFTGTPAVTYVNGNTVADYGHGDILTLLNVNPANINDSDFIKNGGNGNGNGNNQPAISGANNAVTYIGTPVLLDPSVAVTDDTATVTSVNVWISSGYQVGDELTINGATHGDIANSHGTISYNFDSNNVDPNQHGIYLYASTGSPTLDDFDAALHQIEFSNTTSDPTVGGADTTRTVTWAAHDDADAFSQTVTTTVHVHYAPVIDVDNIGVSQHENGTTTVSGLAVIDADATADELFTLSATTAGAGSGTTVLPASGSGHLTDINATLAAGVTYYQGENPPATDMVTLTVADARGAADTVNLIFNVADDPDTPVTLTGTTGKDVFFGTGHEDQFVFAAHSGHDTIMNFHSEHDQIDLSAVVTGVTTGADAANWFSQHVAAVSDSNDVLITIDAADTIRLHNPVGHLTANDFILHPATG